MLLVTGHDIPDPEEPCATEALWNDNLGNFTPPTTQEVVDGIKEVLDPTNTGALDETQIPKATWEANKITVRLYEVIKNNTRYCICGILVLDQNQTDVEVSVTAHLVGSA